MTRAEENALIALAAAARRHAYAPYSRFAVGAAVVADDGRTFFGSNVENASLGLSLCAERTAMAAGVCSGMRRLLAVVVVTDTTAPAMPCGACLQWMAEFGSGATEIVSATVGGAVRRTTVGALLKEPFER